MDGTILDTLEDMTDSINAALQEENFPERTLEEAAKIAAYNSKAHPGGGAPVRGKRQPPAGGAGRAGRHP